MNQLDVNVSDDVLLNNLGPGFAEFDNLGMDDFEFDRLDDLLTQHQLATDEDRMSQTSFSNIPSDSRCDPGLQSQNIDRYSQSAAIQPPRTNQLQGSQAIQQQQRTPEQYRDNSSAFYQNVALSSQDPTARSRYPVAEPNSSTRHLNGLNQNQSTVVDHNFRRSHTDVQEEQQQQLFMQRRMQHLQQQRQLQARRVQQQMLAQHQNAANRPNVSQNHRGVIPNNSVVWPPDLYHQQSAVYSEQSAAPMASPDYRPILDAHMKHSPHAVVPVNSPMGPVINSDCLLRQQAGCNVMSGGLEDWPGDVLTLDGFDESALESLLQELVDTDEAPSSDGDVQQKQITMSLSQQSLLNKNCRFPDTPPESGSEPYSPPDNCQMYTEKSNPDIKPNLVIPANLLPNSHSTEMQVTPAPLYVQTEFQRLQRNQAKQHNQQGALDTVGRDVRQNQRMADERLGDKLSVTDGRVSDENYPPTMSDVDARFSISQHRDSLSHKNKKRKHSISPTGTINLSRMNELNAAFVGINTVPKPEPATMIDDFEEDDVMGGRTYDGSVDGGACQVIKWTDHAPIQWMKMSDDRGRDVIVTSYRVDADKGFNFSAHDDVFVCQKKNHFQVTVHICFNVAPTRVRTATGALVPIEGLYVHFYGIKSESPTQRIKIEQSQADRTRKTLPAYRVELATDQPTSKVVVGRLHFSETTTNNMRKRGRPNPDQRYFQLVVALCAHHSGGREEVILTAHQSDKIIVRASNPGQFDGDPDSPWNKGRTPESVFHCGNVGVNTDSPDEALTVHGNIRLTGHVVAPSDIRVKQDIKELDTGEQLKNINQLKVYHYEFSPEFAKYAGLDPNNTGDTGMLAQEVKTVLPDAVQEIGDVHLSNGETVENLLVVNKDRIFIENIGAVKELCKVTDKLESRISHIENLNKKLAKWNISGSFKSTTSSKSSSSSTSSTSSSAPRPPHHHHHHHRHHHRHDEQMTEAERKKMEHDQKPCNNRVVQIIIVVLVLVMALCVTTITSLYLVDRSSSVAVLVPDTSGSNSSSTPSGYNTSTDSGGAGTLDNFTTQPAYFGVLYGDTPLPINLPACKLRACPVQCCQTTTPNGADTFRLTVTQNSTDISSNESNMASTVSAEGQDDVDMVWPGVSPGSQQNVSTTVSPQSSSGRNINQTLSSLLTSRLSTTTSGLSSTTNGAKTSITESSSTQGVNNPLSAASPSRTSTSTTSHSVVKRDTQDIPPVNISLMEVNLTLTAAYCDDDNCRSRTGSNYTYIVLLDLTFPIDSITIHFTTTLGYAAIMCSEDVLLDCPTATSVNGQQLIHQVGQNLFSLPVGYSGSVRYTFRITDDQTSPICDNPDVVLGRDYSEYALLFTRLSCS